MVMNEIRLVIPDESLLADAAAYKAEFTACVESMDGSGMLRHQSPEEWLVTCQRLLSEETCPQGLVPATQYVCVNGEGRIVGMIDLRHRLNEHLAEFGGHIGYSVRPAERRKGYASQMLAMVLPEAEKLGFDRVLVTCDKGNEASRRTIERNGGRFEREARDGDEIVLRYWINI